MYPCETIEHGLKTSLHVTLIASLFFCVLGNGVICLIVARHYQLQTVTNAHIVNMAIGHLLFAVFCVPMYLSILSRVQLSAWLCSMFGFFFALFAAVSMLALLLIAIERHHAIKSMTKSKLSAITSTRMILVTWLLSIGYACGWTLANPSETKCTLGSSQLIHFHSCLPYLKPPNTSFSRVTNLLLITCCFFVPLTATLVLYCKIARPLWRGYNLVRPLGSGNPKMVRFTAEIRTARTMFIIFLLFLTSWALYWGIGFYNSYHWPSKTVDNDILTTIIICFAFSSISWNPIIYALRNPRISIILHRRK
ncbi:predicted protein, partial [Nematostella vectensis]